MLVNYIRFLLRIYRKMDVSPPRCRYVPTCSSYADEALHKYGLFNGGFLALKRLFRCNQWFAGGYDPVP